MGEVKTEFQRRAMIVLLVIAWCCRLRRCSVSGFGDVLPESGSIMLEGQTVTWKIKGPALG